MAGEIYRFATAEQAAAFGELEKLKAEEKALETKAATAWTKFHELLDHTQPVGECDECHAQHTLGVVLIHPQTLTKVGRRVDHTGAGTDEGKLVRALRAGLSAKDFKKYVTELPVRSTETHVNESALKAAAALDAKLKAIIDSAYTPGRPKVVRIFPEEASQENLIAARHALRQAPSQESIASA